MISEALPSPPSSRNLSGTALGLRGAVRALVQSRLFWMGLVLKLLCGTLFGSHVATRWFAPFAYEFVHGHFANPWDVFLARGETLAFPYGPGMLAVVSTSWWPALFFSFRPSSHFGLFLLRLPQLAADLVLCVLLIRWLRVHVRDVVIAYWLSPITLYAIYIHGQLDLIPTALLCVALYLMFEKRIVAAGAVFGFALSTKLHLLVAAPFAVVYLFRLRRSRLAWWIFPGVAFATTVALYGIPVASPGFSQMVFGSAESQKIWTVSLSYGAQGVLYLAPAAILVTFLRFASYRKVDRDLTLMFVGALYVGLVALVPPQPGWFIWSLPFVAYLCARFTRTGRFVTWVLSSAYLVYFFVEDPVLFLEAGDPTFGTGFGARTASVMSDWLPFIGTRQGTSAAWTLLFSAAALTALEMYRKGVRSNSIYRFRDDTFMMGIGGDSGSGKHTFAEDLGKLLGPQLGVVHGDDDHKWERGHAMWRRYTHLDPRGNLLGAQQEGLAALRRGGDVEKAHYDHDKGAFTNPFRISPNDFVAIVGLHPFYLPSQRKLLHLKVFIDTEESLRRKWKVARDMAKRGYTEERVLAQIEERTADSLKYVLPQRKYADVVISHREPGTEQGADTVAMDVELMSGLEPLALMDLLESVPSLQVAWATDEALTRDELRIRGTVSDVQLRWLATALVPNVDELFEVDAWLSGGRGLAQVVIAHAISVRLRSPANALDRETTLIV